MKKINFTSKTSSREKLEKLAESLEELKTEFSDVLDEYEENNAKQNVLFTLSEALASVEDAIDGIQDVLEEE